MYKKYYKSLLSAPWKEALLCLLTVEAQDLTLAGNSRTEAFYGSRK